MRYEARFGYRTGMSALAFAVGLGAVTVRLWFAGTWWVFPAGVVTLLLVIATVAELLEARKRIVAFAIDERGVYFGPPKSVVDRTTQLVEWRRILAVEVFDERLRHGPSKYRCVAVRVPVRDIRARHEGTDPLATSFPPEIANLYLRAGRPDLLPGADGTGRLAYRRMQGWRTDIRTLRAAAAFFAPDVPVVRGGSWPPDLTWTEGLRARKRDRPPDH